MKRAAAIATALAAATVLLSSGCESLQRAALPVLEAQSLDGLYRLAPDDADTVWLTIDDGPSVETGEILDILAEYGATATFFVHTDEIATPDMMVRLVAEGHNLGNHMPRDRDWSRDSEASFREGFLESHCILSEMGGAYTGLFRPPLGRINRGTMLPVLNDVGTPAEQAFVMASYVPWDAGGVTETPWRAGNRTFAARYGRGLGLVAQSGEIVVFHDGPREERTRWTKLSLRRFLETLERRGMKARALPPAESSVAPCS